MRKNFRRGRLPLCHTTALRIVYSIQLMVGRDIVTNTCYDKGRFCEPSFGSIGIVRFQQSAGPIAACAPISQIKCFETADVRFRTTAVTYSITSDGSPCAVREQE